MLTEPPVRSTQDNGDEPQPGQLRSLAELLLDIYEYGKERSLSQVPPQVDERPAGARMKPERSKNKSLLG